MPVFSPPFLPALHDLRDQVRRDGLRGTWAAERWRLRAALASEEELIVMVADLERIAEPKFGRELRIEDLAPRHLPALADLNRSRLSTRSDRRFKQWLRHGYRGYIVFRGDDVVGYYWWVDRSVNPPHPDLAKLGLDIELAAGDVYGCDYFILEEQRGRGTATDFLHKVESDLRYKGYRRIWGYVVSTNRPARWLYASRGYRPVKTIRATTRLWRRTARISEI